MSSKNGGSELAKIMKKTKKGKLRLKGGFDKKKKRKKKSKEKQLAKATGSSKEPLTEKRAQELMFKSMGEENLKKLMATSSVPSAKEFMYVGGKYIQKGSASDLLEQRTKKSSDHW
eukprot:CAMPEP_0197521850 /NCGR_PEP_ID=MMETSP1318-20131121/7073_1 /TAXON_ID=552666 /ORGANISM="Partenskyella glossopodia, Strain RCC365" /LENGTH=115 /DNA_ID=CAMNT_0043073997 /DNA_START=118 /DNA_END=462 /DNA_ORIENTATION=+